MFDQEVERGRGRPPHWVITLYNRCDELYTYGRASFHTGRAAS